MRPVPTTRRLVAIASALVFACGSSSAQTPNPPPRPRASASAAPAKTAARSFDLPAHGTLLLTVPADWKDSVSSPPGDLPPTIGFEPASGAEFQIMVTPIWGPPGTAAERFSPEDVRALAEKQGRKIMQESVETDLSLKEIKGPQVAGHLFALTDKSLLARAPGEGEYRCLTQAIVLVGDVLITVTVLSQEHDTAAVRSALEMIRTARLRS